MHILTGTAYSLYRVSCLQNSVPGICNFIIGAVKFMSAFLISCKPKIRIAEMSHFLTKASGVQELFFLKYGKIASLKILVIFQTDI